MGQGYLLSCLFSSLVYSLARLLLSVRFPIFLFCLLYLFFSFVHPFPFHQNSHHSVSRPEIVGGDRTLV